MPGRQKVIISCAVTGAIHTPSMSSHLPVTPNEIAESAIAAAEAGAAILHLHARDELDGRPTQDPEVFHRFLPEIRRACDAVINITTGGSPHMDVADRMRPVVELKPELASLNMGSINFGLYPMLDRFDTFDHAWERAHLENSRDLVFKNTFSDIDHILNTCAENHTRFEYECYDIGHLYNLAHFRQRKLTPSPMFIQSVFGLLGGIGAHPEDVDHMHRTTARLFGDECQWSVLGAGKHQMPIAAQSLALGGHVRVGLEDSLWLGRGQLAQTNAEQVRKVRQIIEGLSLEVASPDEAREILGLKGQHTLGF